MNSGLQVEVFNTTFQNPVLLAAGTCGFGLELDEVVELEALGGIVTKSVTLEGHKHGVSDEAENVARLTISVIELRPV